MTLPKTNRLKSKKEFTRLFLATRPIVSESFSLRASQNSADDHKFAVLVPAKIVPLASARNTLRRRVSAALSDTVKAHPVKPGTHAVISLRVARLPEPQKLESELLSLMHKSGILRT